ncbi:unnamed protein product [Microthlaspi erraticum]|uniref:F-box domain-containing protein n=1 Tax=Microthlaspi erraticum TaxID=1685480 RepID=A0A6D2L5M2_9BRAS|nr:unnamed protein product [Microthlaspi erraticum]
MSSPPPPRSTGEEPSIEKPKKKRKKPSPALPQTPESTLVPSLPDDLLISSFARISRLHYPSLSLVSKSFRSLLTSPVLYETRSLLGRTESCLYVCLKFYPDPNPRWFTLCRRPNRALTNSTRKKKKEKPSGHLLLPIRIPNSPRAHWQGVVTIGSSIYSIGGTSEDLPSSSVWVLDCHCHVWRKAPSMRVERACPAANVFDGKIYVAGGVNNFNSSNWIEVFDPKTQTWESLLCPIVEKCSASVDKTAVIDGRIIYMFHNERSVVYSPKEDRWEGRRGLAMTILDLGWASYSYCVVDNVLCCFEISAALKWFDFKRQYWIDIEGLKGLPKLAGYSCVKMANYGGKLAVFWTKYHRASGYKEKRIFCAVIAIERRKSDDDDDDDDDEEVWGTVEWIDPLLTVNSSRFECALAAIV